MLHLLSLLVSGCHHYVVPVRICQPHHHCHVVLEHAKVCGRSAIFAFPWNRS